MPKVFLVKRLLPNSAITCRPKSSSCVSLEEAMKPSYGVRSCFQDDQSSFVSRQLKENKDGEINILLPPLSGLYLPQKYHELQQRLFQTDCTLAFTPITSQSQTSPCLTSPTNDVIIPSPVGKQAGAFDDNIVLSPTDATRSEEHNVIRENPDDVSNRRHQCEVCLKWFKRASSLSNHRLIHKNSKAYKCSHCQMTFLRKSDLGKHVAVHSGSKPYQCKTCGKRFSQSSNMLTHQRRHSGIRPYSCLFCGKSFYRKVDVRRHSSVHRELA